MKPEFYLIALNPLKTKPMWKYFSVQSSKILQRVLFCSKTVPLNLLITLHLRWRWVRNISGIALKVEKKKYTEKNIFYCHFFNHKSHTYRPRIEPGSPQWEVEDRPSDPRPVLQREKLICFISRTGFLTERNKQHDVLPLARAVSKCNVGQYLFFLVRVMQNIHTRVGTLIVATIYLQLIQNSFMFRSFTILQCSHQHCVQPVASDVEVVGYL